MTLGVSSELASSTKHQFQVRIRLREHERDRARQQPGAVVGRHDDRDLGTCGELKLAEPLGEHVHGLRALQLAGADVQACQRGRVPVEPVAVVPHGLFERLERAEPLVDAGELLAVIHQRAAVILQPARHVLEDLALLFDDSAQPGQLFGHCLVIHPGDDSRWSYR